MGRVTRCRPIGSGRRSRRGKSAPPRWTHDAGVPCGCPHDSQPSVQQRAPIDAWDDSGGAAARCRSGALLPTSL